MTDASRDACECPSKNLSVTWLSREDALSFGLHPRSDDGPWCSRCGRPRSAEENAAWVAWREQSRKGLDTAK